MQRVRQLRDHLSQSACAQQYRPGAPAILNDPPDNWPEWLPFPVHTTVPRFALGDTDANAFLEREGYVVFKDVLDVAEVATALEKLWAEIESRSDGVKRGDPTTWDNGWRTNGVAHDDFLWFVRGCPNVRRIWEQLHGTDDLIVSFDAANVWKPWGLNPDWRSNAGKMHYDRRNTKGVPDGYIQGFVNLCPTSPETGGNYVVPRSHLVYDELEAWKQSLPAEQREEFYKLVAEQRPEIFREVINAHLEPGDAFLWTDMTLHQRCPGRGVGPTKPELIRAAVYVCMSPKSKATPEVLEERRKAVYCVAAPHPFTRLALIFSTSAFVNMSAARVQWHRRCRKRPHRASPDDRELEELAAGGRFEERISNRAAYRSTAAFGGMNARRCTRV